ncbi:unnamed protein product [Camellia sinensis]
MLMFDWKFWTLNLEQGLQNSRLQGLSMLIFFNNNVNHLFVKEEKMPHWKFEHPLHRSLGFLPRKRAARHRGKGIVTRFLKYIQRDVLPTDIFRVGVCFLWNACL